MCCLCSILIYAYLCICIYLYMHIFAFAYFYFHFILLITYYQHMLHHHLLFVSASLVSMHLPLCLQRYLPNLHLLLKADQLVRAAVGEGANIVLLQELFSGLYWCQEQKGKYFDWAEEEADSKVVKHFSQVRMISSLHLCM